MAADLDELARTLRLHGSEVVQADLGERWGKRLPLQSKARVYAALRGEVGWA
ncbi:hypothetical protein A7982_13875 [Minicystis rosea]|nr:hypothetical protein A7982_13875 [Minicystis rosea]